MVKCSPKLSLYDNLGQRGNTLPRNLDVTARRFAAPRNGRRTAGWTDFWESAGLRMKTAALPAAALLSRVFCITQIRFLGRMIGFHLSAGPNSQLPVSGHYSRASRDCKTAGKGPQSNPFSLFAGYGTAKALDHIQSSQASPGGIWTICVTARGRRNSCIGGNYSVDPRL